LPQRQRETFNADSEFAQRVNEDSKEEANKPEHPYQPEGEHYWRSGERSMGL